jgi:hypothetical protein
MVVHNRRRSFVRGNQACAAVRSRLPLFVTTLHSPFPSSLSTCTPRPQTLHLSTNRGFPSQRRCSPHHSLQMHTSCNGLCSRHSAKACSPSLSLSLSPSLSPLLSLILCRICCRGRSSMSATKRDRRALSPSGSDTPSDQKDHARGRTTPDWDLKQSLFRSKYPSPALGAHHCARHIPFAWSRRQAQRVRTKVFLSCSTRICAGIIPSPLSDHACSTSLFRRSFRMIRELCPECT